MSEIVIKIENLSKKFARNLKLSMLYGGIDAAKGMFGVHPTKKLRKSEFWALKNINFELKKGETLGLIGQNGCGKTTLLKLINGIYPPDTGKITINGRISALIAIGAGFHKDMTGRENIYLNGTILGMSKYEIKQKMQDIVDFADIGEFLDAPVSTFSSGMTVRLGFAIAIHIKPQIMLIDEVFAVGDFNFQMKCLEKIKELRKSGISFIVVSHSNQIINTICSKAILFDHGQIIKYGKTKDVLSCYMELNNAQVVREVQKTKSAIQTATRRGDGRIRLSEVLFKDIDNNVVKKIPFGTKKVKICAKYNTDYKIENLAISCMLRDATKSDYIIPVGFKTNNIYHIGEIQGEGEFTFIVKMPRLGVGLYGIYLSINDSEIGNIQYDVWDINNTFLEVVASDLLPSNDIYLTSPYYLPDFEFVHRKL